MSDKTDEILGIIDGGLQSSSEPGFGDDYRRDRCVRCQRNDPADDGDLCDGCRAFLLDDSDEDPKNETAWHMPRLESLEIGPVDVSNREFRWAAPRTDHHAWGVARDIAEAESRRDRNPYGASLGPPMHFEFTGVRIVRLDEGGNPVCEPVPISGVSGDFVIMDDIVDNAERSYRSAWQVQSVGASVAALREALLEAREVLEDLFAEAVRRVRHGSASVCPVHGETRGGTCLRCARRRH